MANLYFYSIYHKYKNTAEDQPISMNQHHI